MRQADHNATGNYNLRDPYLTKLGEDQCLAIPERFPAQPPVELLATSPLRRTVQTMLLGFAAQVAAGVPVVALAELQETSSMPCDTGSDAAELAADPRLAATATGASVVLDFSALPADWTSKAGRWAPAPGPLKARAQWVRRWLKDRPEAHVVVVLHAVFLRYVTDDWTGSKGPPPLLAFPRPCSPPVPPCSPPVPPCSPLLLTGTRLPRHWLEKRRVPPLHVGRGRRAQAGRDGREPSKPRRHPARQGRDEAVGRQSPQELTPSQCVREDALVRLMGYGQRRHVLQARGRR